MYNQLASYTSCLQTLPKGWSDHLTLLASKYFTKTLHICWNTWMRREHIAHLPMALSFQFSFAALVSDFAPVQPWEWEECEQITLSLTAPSDPPREWTPGLGSWALRRQWSKVPGTPAWPSWGAPRKTDCPPSFPAPLGKEENPQIWSRAWIWERI